MLFRHVLYQLSYRPMAMPTGFEPVISSVTGWRFKPAKLRHHIAILVSLFWDGSLTAAVVAHETHVHS